MCAVQAGSASFSACTLTVFCGWALGNATVRSRNVHCPRCSSSELPGLFATYCRAGLVLTAQVPLTFTPDWAGYDTPLWSYSKGFRPKSLNVRFEIKRTCFIDICFKDV